MSDTTKKRLKFAGKLLFVCLLLGILYYSFRDSMGDMLTELANVSPQVVMSLFLTVILYHIFEGHITWLIVHKTHRNIPAGRDSVMLSTALSIRQPLWAAVPASQESIT